MLRCEQVRIGMGLILDLYRELGVFYRAIQKGYRKIKEDRNVSKNFNNLTEVVQCRFDYLKISFILSYQTFVYTPSITVIFADLMVPILHRILMYLHGARFGFIRSNHPEIKPQIPTLSSLLRSSGLHLSIVYFCRVSRNNFIFERHISNLWLKSRLPAECIQLSDTRIKKI